MSSNQFGLGIIEGFYGAPWSLSARLHYSKWLRQNGYGFYIYAPKADEVLRKNWRDTWQEQELEELVEMREAMQSAGIGFGVGFSPFEIYKNYDAEAKAALLEKVRYIDTHLKPDIFCALFDDMKGDQESLAELQVRILNDIVEISTASRFIFCPTYYSLDPILEELFGKRPEGYFETLGSSVDPAIDIFWTGEIICSKSYPSEHLSKMASLLQRKPFLWDNYPVNDVREMCNYFYLRPFENRPGRLAEELAGHVANPMMQPWMSQIPLASLPLSYQRGDSYSPDEIFKELAIKTFGENLGNAILADTRLFSEVGYEELSDAERQDLQTKYSAFTEQPVAQEVIKWLNGDYVFDDSVFADHD